MTIDEKMSSMFLTMRGEFLKKFSKKTRGYIIDARLIINLNGSCKVEILYQHPISGKCHMIDHEISFSENDFTEIIFSKTDYLRSVILEMELIIAELIERPCATTCDYCQLKECSRGKIVGSVEDMKALLKVYKKWEA